MTLKDDIKKIASEIKDEVISKRRYLHQNPELSFKEYNTSAYIKKSLDELDIPWVRIANTGVLGTITGINPSSKVIALRADMDALKISEKNNIEYKSVNDGIMHACGHDVHISSLLGVAGILTKLRSKFRGTVKLVFQPAEEILPGGAVQVIEEQSFIDSNISAIIGQHVMPSIPSGMVGIKSGKFMASMDEIRIRISGKGGHGAEPYNIKDPVVATSAVIMALQQVVSRNNNPATPTVLSFGKIVGDGTINIVPDYVKIEGTFRTMDEKWRENAHDSIRTITKSVAQGYGCTCDIDIKKGYPTLHNNEILTTKVRNLMNEYLGEVNIIETPIWMASEDFAYYSQMIDSCYYLLGVGEKNIDNPSLHTSNFDVNEESIETSIGLMSYLLIKLLDN